MNKLSDEKIQKLIDLVREKPELFDKKHPDFKKVHKKDKIWRNISEQLNTDENNCKTAWRSLRNQFTKCLKDMRGSTGQAADDTKRPYKNFERLLFLKDSLEPRRHVSNFDEWDEVDTAGAMPSHTPCSVPDFYESQASLKTIPIPEPSPMESSVGSLEDVWSLSRTSNVSGSSSAKKKKKNQDSKEVFSGFLEQIASKLDDKPADSVDVFFQSVAQTVKCFNLTPMETATLQCEVMNNVTEQIKIIMQNREKN